MARSFKAEGLPVVELHQRVHEVLMGTIADERRLSLAPQEGTRTYDARLERYELNPDGAGGIWTLLDEWTVAPEQVPLYVERAVETGELPEGSP